MNCPGKHDISISFILMLESSLSFDWRTQFVGISDVFHLLSNLKRYLLPGWGQEPSGCYPITSGVPRGKNKRLHCFAFLLSKSLPDDDDHIFPFLESFCEM